MLPYRVRLNANQVAEVKNFTDNGYKTVFGITYEELCDRYGEDVYVTEYEYNNGKGCCPNSIYGNTYYRYWCASKVFTSFGMRVLHYNIVNKKATQIALIN